MDDEVLLWMDESRVLVPIKRGKQDGGDEASHRGISLYTSIAIIWSAWFGLVAFNTRHLHIKLLNPFTIGLKRGSSLSQKCFLDLNFEWKSFEKYLFPWTLRLAQVQTMLVSVSEGDNNYLLIGPCFKFYFCTYITLILEMPSCVDNTDFDFWWPNKYRAIFLFLW